MFLPDSCPTSHNNNFHYSKTWHIFEKIMRVTINSSVSEPSPSCCLHSDVNTKPTLRSLSSYAVSIMETGPVVIHENSSVLFAWPHTKDTIAIRIIRLGQWMKTNTSVCQHLSLPNVIFQSIWRSYSSLAICMLTKLCRNYNIASAYSITRSNQ